MSDKQSPQHVEVIWGNPILDEGFTTIPNLIIKNYQRVGLTHGEYALLTLMFSFKHDANDPFPSQETLAKHFYGDSYKPEKSERALRKMLKGIEDKELLEISYRYIDGTRSSNQYNFELLINACLKLIQPKKVDNTRVITVSKKKKLPEPKVPVVPEPKVPVVPEPKVPVGCTPKVPIKKKREKDQSKKKNEKESIYPEQVENLDVNPLIKRVLEKQMDRLIAFNLNIFDIELHIKNTEDVYPANEYAFVLDSLLTKMTKKPGSIGSVMNDWLVRNREMNNKSVKSESKRYVREEPKVEWLGKKEVVNDDQADEAYEYLKTTFKNENPYSAESELSVWMDEKYKEHDIAELDYVSLKAAIIQAQKDALDAKWKAWKDSNEKTVSN